jgi:hypothetical protein
MLYLLLMRGGGYFGWVPAGAPSGLTVIDDVGNFVVDDLGNQVITS